MSEDGAYLHQDEPVEFRKLDISVRDAEYIAGNFNVTTIVVRNTYPTTIKLGRVRAIHSTVVESQSIFRDVQIERSKTAKVGRRSISFRLGNIFPFGNSARPAVEFGYDLRPQPVEPIRITAQEGSNIDISAIMDVNRRIEIDVAEGANVKISDPVERMLDSQQVSKATLSPTSEVITGFEWTTKNALLFIPTRVSIDIEVTYEIKGEMRSQVTATTLDIKPPIYSIVIGGIVGSFTGSLARSFTSEVFTLDFKLVIKVVASCLLAIMAVVSLSRKSGAQAFITVEDFFGAFVLGSLIGYSGTGFFEGKVLPAIDGTKKPSG